MNQFNNLAVGLDWKLDIGSITLTAFQLHVLYHFQGKDNPKQMIFLNQLHFSFRIKSSNVNLCKCHDSIHGLQSPNEGINQRYLKNWADVADKIFFGST